MPTEVPKDSPIALRDEAARARKERESDEEVRRVADRREGEPQGEDLSNLPPGATNVGAADAGIGEGQSRKKGDVMDVRTKERLRAEREARGDTGEGEARE